MVVKFWNRLDIWVVWVFWWCACRYGPESVYVCVYVCVWVGVWLAGSTCRYVA